jgi:SagB-type dehydrogenase family enzyme
MKKIIFSVSVIFILLAVSSNISCQDQSERTIAQNLIQLPSPNFDGSTSIEEALLERRSVRNYSSEQLNLSDLSQILWSAQGITDKTYGLRTAPSAGALYPLEIYVASANVKSLGPGLYKYNPHDHTISLISEGDIRDDISNASLKQGAITNSSAIIIITAIYERTSVKYGKRAERYVFMEAGHAGQNIYLQCVSLGLGTVMIGAFNDDALKKVLNLPDSEHPLALYPVGNFK